MNYHFLLTIDNSIHVSIALDEHEEKMHQIEDLKKFHIDHHSMLRINLNKKLGSVKKTITASYKVLNQQNLKF